MDHVYHKCNYGCLGCIYCDGGILFCIVCKKGEVELAPECFGPITLHRRSNHLIEYWNIVYRSVRVGMLVKSHDQYVVVRCKKDHLEVATRKPTFGEAKEFIMNGGKA